VKQANVNALTSETVLRRKMTVFVHTLKHIYWTFFQMFSFEKKQSSNASI